MFTGIIEGMGTIAAVRSAGEGRRLTIDADFALEGTKIGDSICVSGACLTAVRIAGRRFEVDISPETLRRTTFSDVRVGERVNLERALRFSDRIDGHLVSGHIDGVGIIRRKETAGNAVVVAIEVHESLVRYMIAKGSVAVDGISLTINTCEQGVFSASIIPHTAAVTTIGLKGRGKAVNIEADMIGKYVERFVERLQPAQHKRLADESAVDRQFLIKTGFID